MSSGEVHQGTVSFVEKKITKLGYDSCSTKMVPIGSVVVALAGQGKTRGTVARTRTELCTNQSLCSIIGNPQIINNDFIYYYLSSQYQQLRTVSSGDGTRGGLNLKMINSYKIPLPPLPIQQRIVEILDKFTSLVSSLDSEIALRQKQYEYYRNKLLSFEEGVKMVALSDVCEIKNGKDYKHLSSGIIPVWGTGGIMTYVDQYAYNGPSVLLPRKGSIDKVYYSEGPVWTVDTLFYTIIKESIIYPKFLYHTISIQDLRALDTSKGNRPSLTQTVLNKILIPLPPLNRQLSIVRTLDTFESLLTNLKKERELRQKQYEYYREKLLTFA